MRPGHFVTLALLLVPIPAAASGEQSQEPARAPALQGRPFTPAGELVVDADTGRPTVGALPVAFVRSPDVSGPGGRGRFLVTVNSGYGVQRDAKSRPAQSLAVIDLDAQPAPRVVQNVDFPSPRSAQVGVAFSPVRGHDGTWPLYVSGGFENQVRIFYFDPERERPIFPELAAARAISVAGFATRASSPRYNSDVEPVYPLGLALSPDGDTLFVANHLADNLGIVRGLRAERTLERVDLRAYDRELVYPYGVAALADPEGRRTAKVYVSCWGTDTVAVVEPERPDRPIERIAVRRHPTALLLSPTGALLYVVNSNADAVSVIATASDRVVETIDVGLSPGERVGASPEGLALTGDASTLYVANAHSHTVAVVALAARSHGLFAGEPDDEDDDQGDEDEERSRVVGFIPTGLYPSAVAVVGSRVFIGNGKGTGFENSSLEVNASGMAPNAPNERFPAHAGSLVGQYVVSLMSGNVSWLDEPDPRTLARYTQQAMRSNGLIGPPRTRLFAQQSPIRHVIYVIKENRTYDQVFGDLAAAGNGERADGDPTLAIFGAGTAARRAAPSGGIGGESTVGPPVNVTPNQRALALRFGLLDRFFVNSDASPDGHNWATAAFSSDFVDKSFRWSYSGRGGSYDFEGFNRLPSLEPRKGVEPALPTPVTADDVVELMKRYVPYLQGGRDVAEPESLYLWDAAARAGLSYRNYGEFIGTISRGDVDAFNANATKPYPDVSPNEATLATKRSLEDHHSPAFRNYDLTTPDAMTVESYVAARAGGVDPLISVDHPDPRFRGHSRVGAWLDEFRGYVEARETGKGEELPNLSILRLSNNHTAGLRPGMPTPQLMVADNDYALGVLVEAVSKSPYWRDTAIFVVEDDAQNGPDHVDAHRSPALVVSAYNRPGELIHEFHNTVSLIRTIELLLGIEPMNVLDAAAVPIDVFRDEADLTPYEAVLPEMALDNLMNPEPRDAEAAYWVERTREQNLDHADMADPEVLNRILWFSVRGAASPMPAIARLPAFDALRFGIASEAEEEKEDDVIGRLRTLLARR